MQQRISSEEVRATFLDFFGEHGHRRIGNASLIPRNDPTLLFVNSGMAPLKPYFTGQEEPPHRDLCNVQPCLRTIDIEDVGDRHHLTFFEMLGSWSIGGYFKERAIELAYELLTARYGLDPARLYASVFAGDPNLGLPPDEESAQYWEAIGIPRERIVALGLSDNFWGPAGETGPCGPCTEVFYDSGPEYGEAYRPGDEFGTSSRYIEIWNAGVFMQFDKKRDGTFVPLPFFSVDTGAGLERLTMALNELPTVYDIDLFVPLVTRCQEMLGQSGEVLPHHRLLADHLRAATFLLAEGVRPSNEGRGYVPRRLIRKCVAVAHRQGVEGFDLARVADEVIALMSAHYPALNDRRDEILSMLSGEEREFSLALQRGFDQLEDLYEAGQGISGADAFRLFSTYGLPFEITRDLAAERGIAVDEAGYRDEFRRHQETSRGGGTASASNRLPPNDPLPDLPLSGPAQFVGYDATESTGQVLALFVEGRPTDELLAGDEAEVLLDTTPFYAESGGQVGDTGKLVGDGGSFLSVEDTIKHGSGYHVHRGRMQKGALRVGQSVTAQVDETKRRDTEANHSATHLLNAALREVLGGHVRQAGSLVDSERLRFDFTNPGPVSTEQLAEIERRVNLRILEQHPRTVRVLPLSEAKRTGAVYLENEDYASPVRVVSFDGVSTEFCGGTHVAGTGVIGLFKVLGEQAVASGVRRVNAVTRHAALDVMLERERALNTTVAKLKTNPASLPDRVEQLLQAAKNKTRAVTSGSAQVDIEVDRDGPVPTAGAVIHEEADARALAIQQAEALEAVVSLAGPARGRSRVIVAVPPVLADRVDARQVLQDLLVPISGRGGGSPRLAEGGGEPSEQLEELLGRLPTSVARLVADTAP